ncbi:hypothetical protein LNA01_10800 [Companilactobacillus nantensis]|nr:hypothetical protein LNA01_10800 [Companilactobacillus nantensis]
MHAGFACDLLNYEKRKKLACEARFRATACPTALKNNLIKKVRILRIYILSKEFEPIYLPKFNY